jgi:signal transduction histidine kinase
MVIIQDVTEFTQKTYQLSLLREISLAMQGVFERDKLLHLILTCVTAGFAIGFNRAFLFLVDNQQHELRGIMGVGPTSHEEAYQIWHELSLETFTLQDYLKNGEKGELAESKLQDLIENISFDLRTTHNVLTETVNQSRFIHVFNGWENNLVDNTIKKFLVSGEFVTIPLIAKNQVIGVLMADNAFTGRSITNESIEVLTMFAGSAAAAIENAKILSDREEKVKELQKVNLELENTQNLLIHNEKLAAIGQVSARLAHEIRNPLATIGGFAKSISKKYEDRERTTRNANIIVEEVKRLEHILTSVLDFAKPSVPQKSPTEVNEFVKNTLNMLEGAVVSKGVVVVANLSEDDIVTEFDPSQMKQVLLNVIQNALNAMPEGGALEIKTSLHEDIMRIDVNDTGKGIPEYYLENIFEPFFTTGGEGTGLGLAISNMIVQNHQGNIEIKSEEGKGTKVSIFLPMKK